MANKTRKFKESGYSYSVNYHHRGDYSTKREANLEAAMWRTKNHCARVVKQKNGYSVYSLKR